MPRSEDKRQAEKTWDVYLFRRRAEWIGTVKAADQQSAIEKAAKELDVPEQDRFRLSVVEA